MIRPHAHAARAIAMALVRPVSRPTMSILVVALLLRLVYLCAFPLLPQETYYWNYAQHLDIGYFDHPPLIAWLIALGQLLLGQTIAGVRLGAFICGLITIVFIHRFALRLVDTSSALMAAALTAALPFFFASGVLATPDAPLIAAWSAALYYSHAALIKGQRRAWLGLGAAMGIGLLSKYSMALLGLSLCAFIVFDWRSWRWFLRWQPYAGVSMAIAIFMPALIWNSRHDWASFVFQTQGRYEAPSFSLHILLMNMLLVATPILLLALPLLLMHRKMKTSRPEPVLSSPRNRLFIACMVVAPLLVFVLNALRYEPRLNWTGPAWLGLFPLAGWALFHAGRAQARTSRLTSLLWRWMKPAPFALLVLNAAVLWHLAAGIPGLPYSQSLARLIGWDAAARQIQHVHDGLIRTTHQAPVVVGMDKYFTASKISYHAARIRTEKFQPPMQVTSRGVVFGGNALMFDYWNQPHQFSGRNLIMVARSKETLQSSELLKYFSKIEPDTYRIPLLKKAPWSSNKLIADYHYRVGYGYRPGIAEH